MDFILCGKKSEKIRFHAQILFQTNLKLFASRKCFVSVTRQFLYSLQCSPYWSWNCDLLKYTSILRRINELDFIQLYTINWFLFPTEIYLIRLYTKSKTTLKLVFGRSNLPLTRYIVYRSVKFSFCLQPTCAFPFIRHCIWQCCPMQREIYFTLHEKQYSTSL